MTQSIFSITPASLLIDRKGVIRAQFPGGDEIFNGDQQVNLRAKIEPLLKEKSAEGAIPPAAATKK
jgi:hypothetical protein